MMNSFNLAEGYDSRLKERERKWHQFFEVFNKPSSEPSLFIDELTESYKRESCVASVQNAVKVDQEQINKQITPRSCLRNKSRKLFSRSKLNSMQTTKHDNNKTNKSCLVDTNVHNTDLVDSLFKTQCEVKLINVLHTKLGKQIINNINLMKEKKRHDSVRSSDIQEGNHQKIVKLDVQDKINEVQEITSDNYFGDNTYVSKICANNFYKFADVEVRVSKNLNNIEEHISKKVKLSHTTSNNNEPVKNVNVLESNDTLIKIGSREEYLQYIEEFHMHEANPDDIIAKIKLMKQFTRGKYKMAKFVLIFLKSNRKQMTADYAIARQCRDEQLKLMKKNFKHSDISLYDSYLEWLYDKRRKF